MEHVMRRWSLLSLICSVTVLLASGCRSDGLLSGTASSLLSPPPGSGSSPTRYTLSVSKSGSGSGTVSSNPAGIACGSSCSASFTAGTSVTLTATPSAGSSFAGWSGACSGASATCTLTMSTNRNVTANFTPAQTSFTATLSWNAPNTYTDGSCLTDLSGYTVYYGTVSGNYAYNQTVAAGGLSCSDTVNSNSCGVIKRCLYTIQGLSAGTWYFAVAAYNTSGLASALSNEASKTLP